MRTWSLCSFVTTFRRFNPIASLDFTAVTSDAFCLQVREYATRSGRGSPVMTMCMISFGSFDMVLPWMILAPPVKSCNTRSAGTFNNLKFSAHCCRDVPKLCRRLVGHDQELELFLFLLVSFCTSRCIFDKLDHLCWSDKVRCYPSKREPKDSLKCWSGSFWV